MKEIKKASHKLGLSSFEIKDTLKKRNPLIIASVAIIGIAFMSNLYQIGRIYGGVGFEDFDFIARLPQFIRFLFGF